MGIAAKLVGYTLICALVNYLALQEQPADSLIFFWPGNALGAVLALHWRSRDRYGRHVRLACFMLLFFVGNYTASLLTSPSMALQQQLYVCLVDTAFVLFYMISMKLVIRHLSWFSSYRYSALLVVPIALSAFAQSLLVGLLPTQLLPSDDLGFVMIDWFSEQLFTGLIVTMLLFGTLTKSWSISFQQVDRTALLLIGLLALLQILLAFSTWLTLVAIVAIPSLIAITRLGFAWVVFVAGGFLLFAMAAQIHFYVVLNSYREAGHFYPEIFANRIDFAMVAVLVIFMAELIAQKKRLVARIRRQAETDALTQLNNRSFVLKAMAARVGRMPMGIAILDIDNFKKINDNYGHPVGDQVIVAVAEALKQSIRRVDIAARWGGEEFLVVFPGIASEDLAVACNRIVEAVRSQVVVHQGQPLRFTVSLGGLYLDDFSGQAFERVFAAADALLYAAKERGKDQAMLDLGRP